MTTTTTNSYVQYATDGSTTTFSIPFSFAQSSDIQVNLINNTTNAVTLLVLNTDYSISGSIVTTIGGSSPRASGSTLEIRLGNVSAAQNLNLTDNSPFSAASINNALDALAYRINELQDIINTQCVKLPRNILTGGTAAPTADIAANTYFGLNNAKQVDLIPGTYSGPGTVLTGLSNDTNPTLSTNLQTNFHDIILQDNHGFIDKNNNYYNKYLSVLNAVNYIQYQNSSTGNNPTITAGGTDSNIGFNYVVKGSGVHTFTGAIKASSTIQLNDNTGIIDSNGNTLISYAKVSNAVNYILYNNAATNTNPIVNASGTDSNIGLNFQAKGTGTYNLQDTSSQVANLYLGAKSAAPGTVYGIIKFPTLASNKTITMPGYSCVLPPSDGAANAVITTDGSGNWSFSQIINVTGNITGAALAGTTGTFSGNVNVGTNAGTLTIKSGNTTPGSLILQTNSGANTTTWTSQNSQNVNLTWQSPTAYPTNTQTLAFNNSGVGSFINLQPYNNLFGLKNFTHDWVAFNTTSANTTGGIGGQNANVVFLPMMVYAPKTLTNGVANFYVDVTTNSGTMLVGIYANGNTGYGNNGPTGAPLTKGTITTSSTGAQSVTVDTTVTLAPGLYWLAYQASGATLALAGITINGISGLPHIGISGAGASSSTPIVGYTVTNTFANGLPTSPALTLWYTTSSVILPLINIVA